MGAGVEGCGVTRHRHGGPRWLSGTGWRGPRDCFLGDEVQEGVFACNGWGHDQTAACVAGGLKWALRVGGGGRAKGGAEAGRVGGGRGRVSVVEVGAAVVCGLLEGQRGEVLPELLPSRPIWIRDRPPVSTGEGHSRGECDGRGSSDQATADSDAFIVGG